MSSLISSQQIAQGAVIDSARAARIVLKGLLLLWRPVRQAFPDGRTPFTSSANWFCDKNSPTVAEIEWSSLPNSFDSWKNCGWVYLATCSIVTIAGKKLSHPSGIQRIKPLEVAVVVVAIAYWIYYRCCCLWSLRTVMTPFVPLLILVLNWLPQLAKHQVYAITYTSHD